MKNTHYTEIYIVEDFDEAQQFKYEHNDEAVEIGTPVGIDKPVVDENSNLVGIDLDCFTGIYYSPGYE